MSNQKLTTEVFKNKNIPAVISEHPLFKDPKQAFKIFKIFPKIGLANFVEEANLEKCLVDFKKDGSPAWNLMLDISNQAINCSELLFRKAESSRYMEMSIDDRIKQSKSILEMFETASLLQEFAEATDPSIPDVKNGSILTSPDGRVVLRLYKDLKNATGEVMVKSNTSVERTYVKFKTEASKFGVALPPLESMASKKVFDKENLPSRKYQIVFSSDGEEGAWDLATMSMRGLRSCQSWESDYPQCLVGSIISGFVGIIYLTSGSPAESHPNYGSLGSKMIKRSLVRYVYDLQANDGKGGPCLLVDRIYPDKENPDREVLNIFMSKLKEKSKIPVYYGPDIRHKLKNMYLPNDHRVLKLLNRERSYQDTPLRFKQEFELELLMKQQTEVAKYYNLFQANLVSYISFQIEKDRSRFESISPKFKSIINSIGLNSSIHGLSTNLIQIIFVNFIPLNPNQYYDGETYYSENLREFFKHKNKIINSVKNDLFSKFIEETGSGIGQADFAPFLEYISGLISIFIKSQIINPFFKRV